MLENDPITTEQINILSMILGEDIEGDLLEGFLIVCSRLVDNFGHHRTHELEDIFQTNKEEGKSCLKKSLLALCKELGSYENYVLSYPVSVNPPNPAFPMLKILGVEKLSEVVYRVLDTSSRIKGSKELVEEYIIRTGELPWAEPPKEPVLRKKPKFVHWCSYVRFATPKDTQEGLQILPEWSNCELKATLATLDIREHVYMAYNGDHHDPDDESLGFYGYFFEPLTQDHPPLLGGQAQIKVFGAPKVLVLEKWCNKRGGWSIV